MVVYIIHISFATSFVCPCNISINLKFILPDALLSNLWSLLVIPLASVSYNTGGKYQYAIVKLQHK